jgi:hypothetical protein
MLVGFAIALSMTKGEHFTSTHSRLGLAVIIAGALQPLNALFRPAPDAAKRWLWNILHKGMGYFAVVAAGPVIYLGLRLLDVRAGDVAAIVYIILFSVSAAAFAVVWLLHSNGRRANEKATIPTDTSAHVNHLFAHNSNKGPAPSL